MRESVPTGSRVNLYLYPARESVPTGSRINLYRYSVRESVTTGSRLVLYRYSVRESVPTGSRECCGHIRVRGTSAFLDNSNECTVTLDADTLKRLGTLSAPPVFLKRIDIIIKLYDIIRKWKTCLWYRSFYVGLQVLNGMCS